MAPSPERPLFSQVARDTAPRVDASSRAFNLMIVLGLLFAAAAFLVELSTRPAALRTVEVDLSVKPDP
jgi:hypothetical protein